MGNVNNVTTCIKMPVYLQYYIRYRYFNGSNCCSGINHFNCFLRTILKTRPKDLEDVPRVKTAEDFEFIIPSIHGKNPLYHNYVSEEDNVMLIKAMEFVFYESLFTYMDASIDFDIKIRLNKRYIKIRYGQRAKQILFFCLRSGIPEKYVNVDTINRAYSRRLEKYKNQIISHKQLTLKFT